MLLLWLVIMAWAFDFRGYMRNEVDGLPSAMQYSTPTWLPNDWYLNLHVGYRHAYNMLLGPVVRGLGFRRAAIVARSFLYLSLSAAVVALARALRLRFSLALLALCAFLARQSLIAGEWMARGLEAKAICYVLVLFSCSAVLRKRHLAAMALAGAAVSFHMLIGVYWVACAGMAILLTRGMRWSVWAPIVKRSWAFLLAGLLGFQAIIEQLLSAGQPTAAGVWRVYVQYRLPHHLVPGTWRGDAWKYGVALAICGFAAMSVFGRSRAVRFLAACAVASMCLFAFGLAAGAWGPPELLRFYWFRLGDVMAPFMSAMLGACVLDALARGCMPFRFVGARAWRRARIALAWGLWIALPAAAGIALAISAVHLRTKYLESIVNPGWLNEAAQPMLEWIARNTPPGAVFLADPTMSDFYIQAQRAMVVSFKNFPQSPRDVSEWYERIKACNGNRTPRQRGPYAAPKELRAGFYKLDERMIRRIGETYGASFYLGHPNQGLPFERLHTACGLTLYRISAAERKADALPGE